MSNQTDNSLIQIFLPIINNALVADGFNNVLVIQNDQPTIQGIPTQPTVYFQKIANKRYGFLGRIDKWLGISSTMEHAESQYFESTWQVMALVLQNPATPNQYTASDLVNEIASIMQSDKTRYILNQSGIGIYRITDVSNPFFVDDRDNFEASPMFDFTLVYENIRTNANPVIDNFNDLIIGV